MIGADHDPTHFSNYDLQINVLRSDGEGSALGFDSQAAAQGAAVRQGMGSPQLRSKCRNLEVRAEDDVILTSARLPTRLNKSETIENASNG